MVTILLEPVVRLALLTCLAIGCAPPGAADLDFTDAPDTDSDGLPDDTDPSGGGGGGDDTDDGVDVDDLPPCTTVCWDWERSAEAARPVAGAPFVQEIEDCNLSGLEPGVCPPDFTCGAPVTQWYSATYAISWPLCEGDLGPHDLVFDVPLADAAPPEPTIPVALRLRLNGGPWPTGGAGAAGNLTFFRVDDGAYAEAPCPVSANGRVDVDLPEGTWRVRFQGHLATYDASVFPLVGRSGLLQVVDEADEPVEIDVVAATVPVDIRVDGSRLTSVPTGVSNVSITLWSPFHGSWVRSLTTGKALPTQLLVEPDVWDLTVSLTEGTSPPFPSGTFEQVEHHEVTVDDPGVFDLLARTTTVSGEVRIDGASPAKSASVYARWTGGGAHGRFLVGEPATGRYAGVVWQGATYEVSVATSGGAAFPSGTITVQRSATPGEVNATLTTVPVAGTVTLNGAQPVGASRGWLQFRTADGSARLDLDRSGAAEFSGRTWSGKADVWHEGGDSQAMPALETKVATQVTPRTDHRFDVSAHRVTVTLQVEGATVTDGSRGSFLFVAVDPGTGAPIATTRNDVVAGDTSVPASTTGALSGTLWLPAATYGLSYQPGSASWAPRGNAALGQILVDGTENVTRRAAVASWSVELTSGGRRLPTPVLVDRGRVSLGNDYVTLPTTGAAKVSGKTWEGALSFAWSCPKDTCGLTEREFIILAGGLSAER